MDAVGRSSVEWNVSTGLTPYPFALEAMQQRASAIAAKGAAEQIWLVEHPPLFTAGTSADPAELLAGDMFPVYPAGRGGRYTYHGPGQRVGYVMIDLGTRGRDIRRFIHELEGWLIGTLAILGVSARRAEGRVGIWVDDRDGREAKIGAIGVRVTRWVSFHGFAINVDPDLAHFSGIVPCGIAEHPVTSLAALGNGATMTDLDAALRAGLHDFLAAITDARVNA